MKPIEQFKKKKLFFHFKGKLYYRVKLLLFFHGNKGKMKIEDFFLARYIFNKVEESSEGWIWI